jgi:hypothetical protein
MWGEQMAAQPDILITTPGGRIMVIEAKVTMNDLPHTEEALKRYMVGMQYPFGLLITPEKGWVCDTLLRLAEPPRLFEPKWSEEIIRETTRTLELKIG